MPTPLLEETNVPLNSAELDILLIGVTDEFRSVLLFKELQEKHLSSFPTNWIRLRIHTLRTLVHKLETARKEVDERAD